MSNRASIPTPTDPFGQAVKQNLDRITGQQRNEPPLPALPETATFSQLLAAYNAFLERVQGTAATRQPAALTPTELAGVLALIEAARFRAESADHRALLALQAAQQAASTGNSNLIIASQVYGAR